MIRTGEQYRAGLRDGREVWINGERVRDVTMHPAFKPIVDAAARMYDMAQEPAHAATMVYSSAIGEPLLEPAAAAHRAGALAREAARAWTPISTTSAASSPGSATKRSARCGRCSTAGTCSTRSTRSSRDNVERHIRRVLTTTSFHVSANTDPKGDRSKRPQDQDPDMLVHVVKETDAGIVFAAPSTRPPLLMPTRRSSNRQSATGPTTIVGLRGWLHRPDGRAGGEAYLPRRVCGPRQRRGLPARQPLRRGRYADHVRQRADPLGGRLLLSPHARRLLHPRARCTAIRPSPTCCASSTSPTC